MSDAARRFILKHTVSSNARALVSRGDCSSRDAKQKKFSMIRLMDNCFLLSLVHGRDAHRAGHQDRCLPLLVPHLVAGLARGKLSDFDLPGQHRSLFPLEQGKKKACFNYWGSPCIARLMGIERFARDVF